MKKIVTRTIGAYTYQMTELGSADAKALFVRTVQAAGPVLGAYLEGAGAAAEGEGLKSIADGTAKAKIAKRLVGMDVKAFSRMFEELAHRLSIDDLNYACEVLGRASQLKGEKGGWLPLDRDRQELHFTGGRLLSLWKWLAFGYEVQFSDFLAVLVGGESPDQEATDLSE